MDEAELAVDLNAALGESPWWDQTRGELVLADTVAGTVIRWHRDTARLTCADIGAMVGSVVGRLSGGLVVALPGGLAVVSEDGIVTDLCPIEPDNHQTRLNDAKCDPAGRLFVGSMSGLNSPGLGSLFAVAPDLTVRKVAGGTTISNGMGWSLNGTVMYFIDSAADVVMAFDYDVGAGTLGRRRTLIEFSPGEGHPDGMTVDAEDYLWVASFGGGFVRRFTPSGVADGTITVPASNVTSCAFGGPSLDELYITTASIELSDEQRSREPAAGGLFVARPGVRGRLDRGFAG